MHVRRRRLLPLEESEVDRRRRRCEAERWDRGWRSPVWIVPPAGVRRRHLRGGLVTGNIQLQALSLELQLPGLSVEVIRLRHHLMCIHHVCRRSLEVHSCLFRDSEIRRADRDIAQRSSLWKLDTGRMYRRAGRPVPQQNNKNRIADSAARLDLV